MRTGEKHFISHSDGSQVGHPDQRLCALAGEGPQVPAVFQRAAPGNEGMQPLPLEEVTGAQIVLISQNEAVLNSGGQLAYFSLSFW